MFFNVIYSSYYAFIIILYPTPHIVIFQLHIKRNEGVHDAIYIDIYRIVSSTCTGMVLLITYFN